MAYRDPLAVLFSYRISLDSLNGYAEETIDPSIVMMASSICSLLLDTTSEEALLRHPDFNTNDLIALSRLMKRSLVTCSQVIPLCIICLSLWYNVSFFLWIQPMSGIMRCRYCSEICEECLSF